ncbi:Carbon monoxide dehydrogenase subunit G [Actinacidiphila yanglinensis]|uniref:Carbon monoxide dehydrogenase subunit G n=1 Tax=Actinacidiphila yanglinensis TaxID=310779 RepID=A0A1H6EBW5_9ACTN|nr:SRPBCC domain-containing protein [Actinacidiphila yanglinensis]SEG94426.1 Carbon monoxide dehydrogenase subunit G [Actinacidiphila yanglinensis]
MEHESFVPIPSARVAETFRTPGAVASALPGWQPDPDAAAGDHVVRGRLRLRIAGSTITYRGFVTVEGDSSPFTVEARGTEVRGDGVVEVTARITLADTDLPQPGTTLEYQGTATATGRLTSYDPAVADAAVRRLLDRFSAGIAEQASAAEPSATDTSEEPRPADEPGVDHPEHPDHEKPKVQGPASEEPDSQEPDSEAEDSEEPDVVDDLGDPAPDLEEFELVEVEVEVPESAAALDDLVPPAEAAHARRTMIGRSAEEVDHAPPRGRYAPVPAPDASSAATLRWAAPAAAALLASAVVVGRVLRRRK